ncbi:PigN-domain-containing protein [Ramaria rubella]|nr:PigN-domain-containing protein [Ramaria rubella]
MVVENGNAPSLVNKIMGSGPATMRLLLLGLVFHIVYIMSVFDCYFTSPVVHGMRHFSTESLEADRVVLIVGDGLRADLLFNLYPFPSIPDSPEVVAPYLRSIVETRGAFGISHTRVPTESRPGHVAIIAGMYEDVSAVTKGWKTNPVNFDSVFNQSYKTFSFGSPDILPMFAHGASEGKVMTWCYDETEEDFTKDATSLDTWVLDGLRTLFQNATSDPELNNQLRTPGIVFFLHLLGLDTTGHSYRPHSKEYMVNIQHVDSIIKQTEELFASFYGDKEKRTAYIFTADHGMSNLGNHGDGDSDNTRTPLIAWGSGIRQPLLAKSPSVAWNLSLKGQDVSQADIAPLMSTLLGRPIPVNSVGVLPDVYAHANDSETQPGYLSSKGSEEAIARASVINAKVILEQYRVKHSIKAAHALSYKPFPMLHSSSFDAEPGTSEMDQLEDLLIASNWREARQMSALLIETALKGLRYLQTYDRWLLRAIVTAGYTGWAVFSALFVMTRYGVWNFNTNASAPRSTLFTSYPRLIAMAVFIASSALFAARRSPATYYAYIAFPIYFWGEIMQELWSRVPYKTNTGSANMSVFEPCLRGGAAVCFLQAMVAGYTHRSIWSIGFVLLGVVWPTTSWPTAFRKNNLGLLTAWSTSCLITGLFPLLHVEKTENLAIILSGGISVCSAGVLLASNTPRALSKKFLLQGLLIIFSMIITYSSVSNLQAKRGLPLLNQVTGWICFATAAVLPFIKQTRTSKPLPRLLELFMAFGPCFVILSISVEGLFYLSFSTTLLLWLEVEARVRATSEIPDLGAKVVTLRGDDVRISLFFLFFVQVAFFGTGNVASISSFYLEPVYRLVPVFNPFLMAALLVFKIVAPYIILSAIFATLTASLNLPPFSLFLVALSLTDGRMTLPFFYNVTDTGSWLEIGQTISFFCITSLLLVWSAGICVTGEWLMAGTLRQEKKSSAHSVTMNR